MVKRTDYLPIAPAPPLDGDGNPMLFLSSEQLAKALRTSKGAIKALMAGPPDPVKEALRAGRSVRGPKKVTYSWEAAWNAMQMLGGREWPEAMKHKAKGAECV